MALFTVVGGALTIGLGAASITTGITGLFATVSALALNTLVGIGINLAVSALAGQQAPSFAVQGQLQAGDDVSRSILLGYSATAGSLVYANTWGKSGKSKNAYLTQVICVSDWRVTGLAGLIVNGAKCTLLPDDPEPNLGVPVQEYRTGGNDHLWVKFYDGTQTVADPLLVNTVSTPDRPYSDKRVGYGCAYAIVTARVNDKLFTGFPTFKFVVNGAPLYDISKDSTKGGDGPHRYDDPATWGGDGDHFPAVQLYNLTRGFYYGDSWFYGMQQVTAARLPSASWIAEIAKCRAPIVVGGVPEPTYRTGGELPINAELGNAVKAILTGCNGRLSEIAGSYDLKLGAPAAPSFNFSDGDIISTEPQSFTPFFGLAETVTGVTGKYPNPADGWNAKACPPIYRADLEAKAGGRRLLADVPFDLVPYPAQAQRLLQAALEEAQRERRHTLVLPPQYWAKAVPGATCEWTVSERNGYVTKLFRIDGAVDRANLDILVDITEVDPSDYDPGEFIPPPEGPTGPIVVPPQALPSFNAVPYTVQDSSGNARRPAIKVSFAGDLDDVRAVQVEVRRTGSTDIIYNYNIPYGNVGADGSTRERILNGTFLPATNYEVRGTLVPISERDVTASDWIAVTTPNVGVDLPDLGPDVRDWQDWIGRGTRELVDELRALAAQVASQDYGNFTDKQVLRRELKSESDRITAAYTEEIIAATGPGSALVARVETLEATIPGLASANALSLLTTRVTNAEGQIAVQSSSLVSLSAEVAGKASAAALSLLDSRVTVTEGQIVSISSALIDVNATLGTKNKTFSQTSPPSATAIGDLWIDTDDGNKIYRAAATGSGSWVALPDQNRNRTFAQANPPTAEAVGDLWIETDDNNEIHRWSGSAWVPLVDPRIATSAAATLALDARVTDAEGDITAIANAVIAVESTLGDVTASANFRAETYAGPAGYSSRIGLEARVGGAGAYRSASLFLDVPASPSSPTRVVVVAEQFAVVNSAGSVLATPFLISGGVVRMQNVRIGTAVLDDGAITSSKVMRLSVS